MCEEASLLRWGIAGAGYISQHFVTALKLFPARHQVVAVGARSADKAKVFAEKHSIASYYGSYKELGSDLQVDVVYVGVITSEHHVVAKELLLQGKHLLVEKPFTLNARLTRQLCDLAKSRNLFLMEAIWSRFLPSYHFALDKIQSGAIGDVLNAQASMCISFPADHNISNKSVGGGSVYAIGVYPINAITYLAYPNLVPEKIKTTGVLKDDGADLAASCCLSFPGGKLASINMDLRANGQNDLIISGTKGQMKLHSPFWCAEQVTVNGETLRFPIHGNETAAEGKYDTYLGLVYQAHEVQRCINSGLIESDLCSHADSLLIAKVEDCMRHEIGHTRPEDNDECE